MNRRPFGRHAPPTASLAIFAGVWLALSSAMGLAAETESPDTVPAQPPADVSTGFEAATAGELSRLETEVGVWSAAPSHATIHEQHARSGRQSLRLLGGEGHQVELKLAGDASKPRFLSFWAERWTRVRPFSFRIEGNVDAAWREIYSGDKAIRIGGFHTHVRVSIPPGMQRLRFTNTSPKNSGLMLDDVTLSPAKPMAFVGVDAEPSRFPVFVDLKENAVLRVRVHTRGDLEPLDLTSIQVTTRGTQRLSDVAAVHVYWNGTAAGLDGAVRFGSTTNIIEAMAISGRQALVPGANHIWIVYELKPTATLDSAFSASCAAVTVAGKKRIPEVQSRPKPQRVGTAVRRHGQDDCHTYRIPGLATTNAGTLIAVYDNRYRGGRDLPNLIDVGMSRSTDGGDTWEPMRVIMDMGKDDEPGARGNGIGDPAILVDRRNGKVWVAALWSHGDRAWNGSGPGLTPDETGQLMLSHSEDDGLTWSAPRNITRQVKDPKWRLLLQGPGNGITLTDGTLVFAAQFRAADGAPGHGKPFSTIIYSHDHGAQWKIGGGAKIDTTEAQVVQLRDGSLMLNCRDNRGGSRSVYTTKDFGQTWNTHPTSRKALPEPVCMASLIRVETEKHGALLFFSNPASTRGRHHGTLKVSNDEGMTWPERWHTLYDERFTAYSCLTRIDDERIGLLYEGTGGLLFLRFRIADLLDEPQSGRKR